MNNTGGIACVYRKCVWTFHDAVVPVYVLLPNNNFGLVMMYFHTLLEPAGQKEHARTYLNPPKHPPTLQHSDRCSSCVHANIEHCLSGQYTQSDGFRVAASSSRNGKRKQEMFDFGNSGQSEKAETILRLQDQSIISCDRELCVKLSWSTCLKIIPPCFCHSTVHLTSWTVIASSSKVLLRTVTMLSQTFPQKKKQNCWTNTQTESSNLHGADLISVDSLVLSLFAWGYLV